MGKIVHQSVDGDMMIYKNIKPDLEDVKSSLAEKATKTDLDVHTAKKASVTELGHLKVDGSSIVVDVNGVISAIGNAGGGVQTAWATGTTYAATDIVSYSGKMYVSLVSSNVGNNPASSPTKWKEYNTDVAPKDLAWNNQLYNGNFVSGTTGFVNVGTGVMSIVSGKMHLDFGATTNGGMRLDDAYNTLKSAPGKKILFRLKGVADGLAASNTKITYQIVNVADGKNQIITSSTVIPGGNINDLLLFTVPSDWAVGALRVYVYLAFTTQGTSIGYATFTSWMALDLGVSTDNLYTYNYTTDQLDAGIVARGDYFQGIAQGVLYAGNAQTANTANVALSGNFPFSDPAWANILQNADGSNGTTYWTTAGAATLSASSGVFSWLSDVQFRAVTQKVNIAAGKTFKFEVEINAVSGATIDLQAAFYQSNGTFISQSPISISTTGDWKKFKGKWTAPSLTGYVNVGIKDDRASGWTTIQFKNPIMVVVSDIVSTNEQLIDLDDLGGFWLGNPKFASLSSRAAQSQRLVTQWTGKKMLTIGDSWTQANKWQPVVVSAHEISSYVNPAIGGTQIGVFMDNVTNIDDIDLVTIMGCLNNYAGASQIGTIDDALNKTGSVYAQCKYIIDKLYTLKPSIKIVWISATNPGQSLPYYPGWNTPNSIGKTYKDYVDAMKAFCEYNSIPFLDLYRLAGINQYTINQWSSDLVHPNDKGYEVVGRMTSEFIRGI